MVLNFGIHIIAHMAWEVTSLPILALLNTIKDYHSISMDSFLLLY